MINCPSVVPVYSAEAIANYMTFIVLLSISMPRTASHRLNTVIRFSPASDRHISSLPLDVKIMDSNPPTLVNFPAAIHGLLAEN